MNQSFWIIIITIAYSLFTYLIVSPNPYPIVFTVAQSSGSEEQVPNVLDPHLPRIWTSERSRSLCNEKTFVSVLDKFMQSCTEKKSYDVCVINAVDFVEMSIKYPLDAMVELSKQIIGLVYLSDLIYLNEAVDEIASDVDNHRIYKENKFDSMWLNHDSRELSNTIWIMNKVNERMRMIATRRNQLVIDAAVKDSVTGGNDREVVTGDGDTRFPVVKNNDLCDLFCAFGKFFELYGKVWSALIFCFVLFLWYFDVAN